MLAWVTSPGLARVQVSVDFINRDFRIESPILAPVPTENSESRQKSLILRFHHSGT